MTLISEMLNIRFDLQPQTKYFGKNIAFYIT